MSASLLHYPDVSSGVLCENAKTLGHASELLVDSVFARLGIPVASFAEHSPFDRMIWIGSNCLRVQVKGRHRMTDGGYHFDIKRGYQRGPNGTREYDRGDFDVLALVGLPHDIVKFTASWSKSHVIRGHEIPGLRNRPGASLQQALDALGLSGTTPADCAI
ncbi:hypothetical protein [Natronohydrobacter thiooxidans]|uniref:hypothetical protein n=1 Tax=Natronohydrobacter thiooxidans TaxID=87172 RepID=UPI0008FF3FB6|nr:hypothetical protein [Natronohydrobacter thiooxidans]